MRENKSFPLLQKKVVATGKLQNYTRAELMTVLGKLGAFPTYKVSRKTDFLIVGTKPGSKLQKAVNLGVCILTEEDFEAMLLRCQFRNNK